MQRDQIANYLRTAGLMVGAMLFILMILRSGQSANSEAAVRGKPSLLVGVQLLRQGGLYNDLAIGGASEITAQSSTASGYQTASVKNDKSQGHQNAGGGSNATVALEKAAQQTVDNAHTVAGVPNIPPGHQK